MIQSLQRIEFIRPNGSEVTLLDIGGYVDKHVEFPIEQKVGTFSPIDAKWGYADAFGGARSSMSWGTIKMFPTNFEAHTSCIRHVSRMPILEVGQIRMTIRPDAGSDDSDDEIWIFDEAVVSSSTPVFFPSLPGAATLTSYRAEVGRRYPVQGEFTMCDPIDWQVVDVDLDTRDIDDTTCAFSGYTPPSPTPGTPLEIEPEIISESPDAPPDLLKDANPPVLAGVTISGITNPTWANGFYTRLTWVAHPSFNRTTADGVASLIQFIAGDPWEISTNTDGFMISESPGPNNPWDVTTWTPTETMTGTPVITPNYL